MIVLLCHDEDAAALWLHRALREQGCAALELVSVEQLVYSRSIVHRLDDRGDLGQIRLADGRVLRPETIAALLNRVRYLPTQHFARAAADGSHLRDQRSSTRSCSRGSTAWRARHQSGAAVRARRRHFRSGYRHARRSHGGPADRRLAGRQRSARQRNRLRTCRRRTRRSSSTGGCSGPPCRVSSMTAVCRLAALVGVPLLQLGSRLRRAVAVRRGDGRRGFPRRRRAARACRPTPHALNAA